MTVTLGPANNMQEMIDRRVPSFIAHRLPCISCHSTPESFVSYEDSHAMSDFFRIRFGCQNAVSPILNAVRSIRDVGEDYGSAHPQRLAQYSGYRTETHRENKQA